VDGILFLSMRLSTLCLKQLFFYEDLGYWPLGPDQATIRSGLEIFTLYGKNLMLHFV
jgi:hypothetical protein